VENFAICYEFVKVLWNRQLLVISEKATEAGLKSAKVFFAKCNLACNSPKFSPAKIFHCTVFAKLVIVCYRAKPDRNVGCHKRPSLTGL